MNRWIEVHREKAFWEGEFNCIVCGKKLRFYFNGGELDQENCCGHMYRTEHVAIDLVVYKKEDEQ